MRREDRQVLSYTSNRLAYTRLGTLVFPRNERMRIEYRVILRTLSIKIKIVIKIAISDRVNFCRRIRPERERSINNIIIIVLHYDYNVVITVTTAISGNNDPLVSSFFFCAENDGELADGRKLTVLNTAGCDFNTRSLHTNPP